jgi:RNA polymerase sigma-70 factor (ECF subfamily)
VATKPDFDSVVEIYGSEIFAYLWRFLNGHEDVEDCLQEVFLRAFRAYGRLDHEANVRAWLYKIATNTAISLRQRRTRREAKEVMIDMEILSGKPPLIEQVELKEQLGRVIGSIERLPDKQRSALIMRKYQECSYTEIASILECSEEAARANVYQALKKLRAEFSK